MTSIDAKNIGYTELNRLIREAEDICTIENCCGQRFIAAGMSDKNISNAGTDLLKITGTSIFINFGDARLSAIGFQKIPVESIGITVK